MVEQGFRDAGYEYIFIDDLWQGGRDRHNNIIPDPKKFPNGIKALGYAPAAFHSSVQKLMLRTMQQMQEIKFSSWFKMFKLLILRICKYKVTLFFSSNTPNPKTFMKH